MRKGWIALALAALGLAGLTAQRLISPGAAPLDPASLAERQAEPLMPPPRGMAVYHLGHSLVGRDMPALLAQMAGPGHVSHGQLGWGASLADHWRGDVAGFAEENAWSAHRPAGGALDSGAYDAVVLTEMVELKDAIRWHDSAAHLARWAARAQAGRTAAGKPAARVYLYETWHRLDDPAGWQARIEADRPALWDAKLVAPAMATEGTGIIRVIPAGQVLSAAATLAEAGGIPGIIARGDFFSDDIHLSPLGAWAVAMTHYAVLYHRAPPTDDRPLALADGTPFAPPPGVGEVLSTLVWRVVRADPATGVARDAP